VIINLKAAGLRAGTNNYTGIYIFLSLLNYFYLALKNYTCGNRRKEDEF